LGPCMALANLLAYVLTGARLKRWSMWGRGLRRIAPGDTRLAPPLPGRSAFLRRGLQPYARQVSAGQRRGAPVAAEAMRTWRVALADAYHPYCRSSRSSILSRERHDELSESPRSRVPWYLLAQRLRGQDSVVDRLLTWLCTPPSRSTAWGKLISRMRPFPLGPSGSGPMRWELSPERLALSESGRWISLPTFRELRPTRATRVDPSPTDRAGGREQRAATRAASLVQIGAGDGVDLGSRVPRQRAGLPVDWRRPGHYGGVCMRGGAWHWSSPSSCRAEDGGLCVSARIPLHPNRWPPTLSAKPL